MVDTNNVCSKRAAERYLGKTFQTKSFGDVLVVGYEGANKILIQFEDGNTSYCRGGDLKNGEVFNPFHKTRYGRGFFGIGPHLHTVNKKTTKEYSHWNSIFYRCYDPKYHASKPTYIGCEVDTQFYCFQEFAEWCQWQVGFKEHDWQLDKDIIDRTNRVYRPDLCVFVPNEINCLINNQKSSRGDYPIGVTFTSNGKFRAQWQENGVQQYSRVYSNPMICFEIYKENKERVIKEVATKWAKLVDERVYLALMSHEVHIDD